MPTFRPRRFSVGFFLLKMRLNQHRPTAMDGDLLRKTFNYCAETGALTWKISPRADIPANSPAGAKAQNDYVRVEYRGKAYMAHRIAWLLHYAGAPVGLIDHINGNKCDNRIANLREASKSENGINSNLRSHNTSGATGVSWNKARKKWQIKVAGVWAGYFKTKQEAALAALKKYEELSPQFSDRVRERLDLFAKEAAHA